MPDSAKRVAPVILTRLDIARLGIGLMVALLGGRYLQEKLAPAPTLRVEVATAGPCFGETSIAELNGLDLISAERARQLMFEAGSGVCVDQRPGSRLEKGPKFILYAWASGRERAIRILFGDQEFNKEAHELPERNNFEDPWLPKPSWIVRASTSPVLKRAGLSGMVREVEHSTHYSAIARGRKPSAIVIARRGPLHAWGQLAPYDFWFRFGGSEVDRFQLIPGVGVLFSGRVDPLGTPFELQQENPYTDR